MVLDRACDIDTQAAECPGILVERGGYFPTPTLPVYLCRRIVWELVTLLWLFLSLCQGGIQVQHPQMLQRLAESCHQVNKSHRYGVTAWSGVIQWLRRTISHCLQLPCAWGVYLSLHNRACMHLGRDVRTWLSREWRLVRNRLEIHLQGLDSVVSLCRLPRHPTVNTYIEAKV